MFLERFVNSGYFFLRPSQFRQSALLLLPFGHQDRPSPALLTAVYLWGSVLCGVTPNDTYTPDSFLACVLQNIPQDLARMDGNPQLVVETIQAEVLLSLYFLHIADPVRGRYHASAAASIAFGANLHLIRSPQHHPIYPPFTLHAPPPPEQNTAEESIRIGAFWAAIIVNNLWAGVAGSPSPIPYTINVDSPWPSSSYVMFYWQFIKLAVNPFHRLARQSRSSSMETTRTGLLPWRSSRRHPFSWNALSRFRHG